MKKLLLASAILVASSAAQADMLLGAEFEATYWKQNLELAGDDMGDKGQPAFSASFEHPIPLVPNIKAGYSTVDSSDLAYDKIDFTLYYEILDNDLVTFDIGVGASLFQNARILQELIEEEFDGAIPHAYAMLEVGIPATPLFLYAKGDGFSYDDNSISDLQVGIKYEIGAYALNFDLLAGYRAQKLEIEDLGDVTIPFEYEAKGFFAGINLDF
ncbi:TIGR04219 family outer membrane beta-barrel protein [Thalassotalea aquiviva]|uniref:TIGR04219 family outer membrane beta-barrel protein n=1 Tax=Thalassotalea aquiviva TaxID=3242415 RepID=UPI00352AF6D1